MQRSFVLMLLMALVARAEALVNVAGPACGTTVHADTQFSAEYGGEKAADGSLERSTGCWYSGDQTALPCALTFRLAFPLDLHTVVLHQAAWNGNMYHTRQFAVEVSANGDNWQRVATGELADENLAKCEVPLTKVHTAWLRIVVLTSYNSFQTCGLAEVELLAEGIPQVSAARFDLGGRTEVRPTSSYCGFAVAGDDGGPQLALTAYPPAALAALRQGEGVAVSFDVSQLRQEAELAATVQAGEQGPVVVSLTAGPASRRVSLRPGGAAELRVTLAAGEAAVPVRLEARATAAEATVRWQDASLRLGGLGLPVRLLPPPAAEQTLPPPLMPALRPAIERAMIEYDWRMQDGIETPRLPVTYAAALAPLLQRGEALLADLRAAGLGLDRESAQWRLLQQEAARAGADEAAAQRLWRRAHWLRREIALRNPLFPRSPLVFAKQVPGAFSHQLTQYYGRYARPGGGICVLPEPGQSMRCVSLTAGKLPPGSYQHPEVSFAGDQLLFSYCEAPAPPGDTRNGHQGRYFHLYEVRADGSGLRQLTEGPFDDFAPRYLPDGRLLLVSTRRQGWHRCGSPGCENYTLTVGNADGSGLHPISYHETQEWDPALLPDGRIIYTRWDYVDRSAVFYEQLWTTGVDGTRPAIFFGNNTFNPVGIWEPRAVPGSRRVMATAAAHHAMTAGSIILVDVAAGVDGKEPLIRLTPEVPFPEGEIRTPPSWFSAKAEPRTTPENDRWPAHCYRSPYPLSERYFLAAYSFEGLVGEARANVPNMFGLYLVDAFGNRELLYRDLEVASAWPVPLRARPLPAAVPQLATEPGVREGAFLLQDVYASAPALPRGAVKWLRVLQVLPKSTPGIDNPAVGLARGAPGKQVVGTVPVEGAGSAYFRAPAGVPLSFQALDARGQAIQVMRSLTYLQPGEVTSCVGCHEPRVVAPPLRRPGAVAQAPATPRPGPEGSRPFSYPRLVQPVLDRACVRCHGAEHQAGRVRLTGEPEGHYTVSYNALAPRVPFSDQGSLDSLSLPDRYGARGSKLMPMLLAGHHGVTLSDEEVERLVTWMDTNALFYGTFDPADQARQQRGELIAGPALQ